MALESAVNDRRLSVNINALQIGKAREERLTLEGLPQEIQAKIYEYAVVEPDRWDRKHDISCKSVPDRANIMEAPPFATVGVVIHDQGRRLETITHCSCGKRKGINLLLTSKLINNIATPIFWSKNTFGFMDPAEFTAAVSYTLRDECRLDIRSVSIINPDTLGIHRYYTYTSVPRRIMDNFWCSLNMCRSLRKLELSPALIQSRTRNPVYMYLHSLNVNAPNLVDISLTFLVPVYKTPTGHEYPVPGWVQEWYHQLLYVKCSRPFLPPPDGFWLAEDLRTAFNEFMYNFRVWVDTGFKLNFLGADPNKLDQYEATWKIKNGLTQDNNVRRVPLPNDETTVVTVYGLPPQPGRRKARARVAKAQKKKAELLEIGQMVAEFEAIRLAQERRMERHGAEMEEEWHMQLGMLRAREERRLWIMEEEEEATREERRVERERLEQAIAETRAMRRLERKRVWTHI